MGLGWVADADTTLAYGSGMDGAAWISQIGYAVPGQPLTQQALTAWLEPRLAPGSDVRRWRRFADRSGITARYSVLDLLGADGTALWPVGGAGAASTAQRSRLFERHALPLAQAAVAAAGGVDPSEVTHLVVATCTGAVAPGLDLQLAQALGLSPGVRRTVIGFMGCYAAIQALRVARDACTAEPQAVVLVVCCELSTLHLPGGPSADALLAACLFGDGASAAVVRWSLAPVGTGLRIAGDQALIIPRSGGHMVWYAGDQGFVIGLSPAITNAIAGDIAPLTARLLGGREPREVRWVVHPGGPRILDAVERVLALGSGALDSSRAALAEAGNRSSGTILAILAKEVASAWQGQVAMMAFGPGLTAEAMLLERA